MELIITATIAVVAAAGFALLERSIYKLDVREPGVLITVL